MLYLIVIILSLILIFFVRKFTPTYSPASVLTLFWTIQILIMVICLSGFLLFKYVGLIYLLICLLSFDIGYTITPKWLKHLSMANPYANVTINKKYCFKVYYFILALAFFRCFYDIISKGFSLSNLFDITTFMEMSHQNSVDRYSGESNEGILSKILGINAMACPLIAGFIYFFVHKRKYISVLGILPSMISGLAQGAKMGIITSIFMWFIGYIISAQLFNIKIKFNVKKIIFLCLFIVGFIFLMGVVMIFRIGEFNDESVKAVIGKSVSYILAHLPAFDIWYYNYRETLGDYTMGGKLFYGITNFLGIMKRDGGIYTSMTIISEDGDKTNVYTVFRIIVEDFGTIGSILFIFVIGCLSRLIYILFNKKMHICICTTLLAFIYFFISWSFVTTIFAYTTYIALILYVYLIFRCILKVNILKCTSHNSKYYNLSRSNLR